MSECDLFAAMFLLWEWNICVIDNWSSHHRGHLSFNLIWCKIKGFMLERMFLIQLSLIDKRNIFVLFCILLFGFMGVFQEKFLSWIVVSMAEFHSMLDVLICCLFDYLVHYSLIDKLAFTLNYDKALIRLRFLSKYYITVFVFYKLHVWTQNDHCVRGQIFEEFRITHAHNLLI